MLAVTEVAGGSERLVLAHGFTQNGAFWETLAGLFPDRHLIAPDLPGHGGSAHYASADLNECARLLGEAGGRADYVGYSLGGRVALHLAFSRPDLVRSVVLVGARPGLATEEARLERVERDEDLAARIESMDSSALASWLRREWLTMDLFRSLPASAAHVELRSRNDSSALAASLRNTSLGRQTYLIPRMCDLQMPVLLMHGEHDRPEIVREVYAMADNLGGGGRVVSIPGAGHSVPFEQPVAFATEVLAFLNES